MGTKTYGGETPPPPASPCPQARQGLRAGTSQLHGAEDWRRATCGLNSTQGDPAHLASHLEHSNCIC